MASVTRERHQQLQIDLERANSKESPKKQPQGGLKPWHYQGLLVMLHTTLVVGGVYLKQAVAALPPARVFSPLVFGCVRDLLSGPLLVLLAWYYSDAKGSLIPGKADMRRVIALGISIAANQLLYIAGVSLAGVMVAACIQPVIPVFTTMLAVSLSMEAGSKRKYVGVGLAVSGSLCMVLGGLTGSSASSPANFHALLAGDACLLMNALSTAAATLLTKQLVAKYPPLLVAAWAFTVAVPLEAGATLLLVAPRYWALPGELLWPLAYWVAVCTVGSYWVAAVATSVLPASQVVSFGCLQPFVGTLLGVAVLNEQPSPWDMGAAGVLAGLYLVSKENERPAAAVPPADEKKIVEA